MAAGVPAGLSREEARRFGLTVGAAFLVLGGLLWWRRGPTPALVVGALGAALILFGVVLPGTLVPVRRGWMAMAAGISKVTTPIFMGIVYFGMFAPVGVIRRLAGRNSLKRPLKDGSYWVVRDRDGSHPEGMEHQF